MQGGMRMDPRGLPVGMQEQAALKLAKEITEKADRVAGHGGGRAAQRVRPKRLCFPSRMAAEMYLRLRDGVRNLVISNVRCVVFKGVVKTIVIYDRPEKIIHIHVNKKSIRGGVVGGK